MSLVWSQCRVTSVIPLQPQPHRSHKYTVKPLRDNIICIHTYIYIHHTNLSCIHTHVYTQCHAYTQKHAQSVHAWASTETCRMNGLSGICVHMQYSWPWWSVNYIESNCMYLYSRTRGSTLELQTEMSGWRDLKRKESSWCIPKVAVDLSRSWNTSYWEIWSMG